MAEKLKVHFDSTVPLPEKFEPEEIKDDLDWARVVIRTSEYMYEKGLIEDTSEEDRHEAIEIFKGMVTGDGKNKPNLDKTTNAVAAHVGALLNEYDKQAVDSATQLRVYITNRLIIESDHKDPKQRMAALVNLGKISEVGLFAERKEITVTHQSTEDLEAQIKEKLAKIYEVEAEVIEDKTDDTSRETETRE